MKKRFVFSLLLGVLVSAITLYLALKNITVSEVSKSILSLDPFWILPTVTVVLISFIIRAIRWKVILRSNGNVSFSGAYHPLMIGFMLNCVLPARAGEIARPIILKQLEGVPFSTGLASVAAERFFDILILIILFALMFQYIEIDSNLNIPFGKYTLNRSLLLSLGEGMVKIGIILICFMLLIASKTVREKTSSIILQLPGVFIRKNKSLKNKFKQKLCIPIIRIMDNIGYGFSILKKPLEIGVCFILSIIIWGFAGLSYYLLSLGFPGVSMTLMEIFIFMIIICFFIALPSAPGYWGLWEAGGVFALTLFGIPTNKAASFTLANHVIQFLPVIIAGIVSMIQTGVHIKQFSFKEISKSHTENNIYIK
jgi:uncharacterized protein (TIRG00374 family)